MLTFVSMLEIQTQRQISQEFVKNIASSLMQNRGTELEARNGKCCEAKEYWTWGNKPKGNEDCDDEELNMI